MRIRHAALAATGVLLLAGCGTDNGDDGDNGVGEAFPRQEVQVAVGEEPPSPEDVGVGDEIEPRDRDTLDVDLATFGRQWNETAGEMGVDGLMIDEWLVGYAMPSGDYTHEFADWLAVYGSWSYGGDLEYAAIEWRFDPDMDGFLAASSWGALVGAVLGLDDPDVVFEALEDLGLVGVDEDDFAAGLDAEVERDGVLFEVYSDDSGGDLTAWPAG